MARGAGALLRRINRDPARPTLASTQVLTAALSDPRQVRALSQHRHSGLSRLGKREQKLAAGLIAPVTGVAVR